MSQINCDSDHWYSASYQLLRIWLQFHFSRNVEHSYHNDKFDIGGQVESNLIWSPKSFVPRSANLNLTANWFGSSINLMEIGGRVEGMEKVMEHFFKGKESIEELANVDWTDSELVSSSWLIRLNL